MKKTAPRKKDVRKLVGRFSLDYILPEGEKPTRPSVRRRGATRGAVRAFPIEPGGDFAMQRLQALQQVKGAGRRTRGGPMMAPVNPAMANWVELGPLAITNGQTYGGARVIVTGRITSICPHPTISNTMYVGTSRGGIWKTTNGGADWYPMSDNAESLAIGALAISTSNPQVLYAGTGEGNLQLYSSDYPLDSAPGIYLGIGVLKSTDGGATWVNQGAALFANKSFYRIAIRNTNPNHAFAATSLGLCRTTDGNTWTNLTGGGLPAVNPATAIIACTDVLVDAADATGNTVFAAFWADGVYKSTNALAASPAWTKLTTGMPAGGSVSRISLVQSPSSPNIKYALFADSADGFHSVRQTTNAAGTTWASSFSTGISLYGAFTNNIAVDPTTPNTLYISGVELYKAVLSGGTWSVTNIGENIHPDSHCFAFDPNDNLTIYSGNDGGIFKSTDGGTTWTDVINKRLNLLQYEAIDDYPTSDAIVLGGTQDNGTNSYRNSVVFHHADDGDGGYCVVNGANGNQQISSYFGSSFKRSGTGGQFGSWFDISAGITGNGLFYPPLAKSPTSARVAVGTDRLEINNTPYTASAWTAVTLPGISGRVSAVTFANDTTIYAATTTGKVYKATLTGSTWTVQSLHAAPLPIGWIWDVVPTPGNINRIMVVFANFGLAAHAWTGTVPATGTATWTATSGAGATSLPDVPYYAIAFQDANTIYVGSDIGVFRTTDAGGSWTNFSQGLPNTAIYDLRFYAAQQLLRAGTHGRGLWEIKTDAIPSPPADLYFRDHLMSTGRLPSAPVATAGFADPLHAVSLNDALYWWQSVDIKVDAPTSATGGYQFPINQVDYVVYESQLQHDNPDKGNVNRVYVRVQNRGTQNALNVVVKPMYAGASAGLPNLPSDFWTAFPNNPAVASPWNAVGPAQTIAVLEPARPVILEWDWTPPTTADTHSCMLVVMDSASDPIPAAQKVFSIAQLVTTEKRVALKNLHLVNVVPLMFTFIPFHFNAMKSWPYTLKLQFDRFSESYKVGMAFPKSLAAIIVKDESHQGFTVRKMSAKDAKALEKQWIDKEFKSSKKVKDYIKSLDLTHVFYAKEKLGAFTINGNNEIREANALLLVTTNKKSTAVCKFSIIQEGKRNEIEGGSTFVIRSRKT